MEHIKKVLIITDDDELKKLLEFCLDGWGYEVLYDNVSELDIGKICDKSPEVILVDVDYSHLNRFEFCERLKRDFSTAYIPLITLIEKENLKGQLLELRVGVDDYLIKPPDPLDLRIRIEMAIKRAQHNLYANSLTGLPGGVVIEEMVKEKIDSQASFVVGHVDIDNFKSFNDKYGYLKGDRVIMQTAYMLSTATKNWGNKSDFVGHIGGDDFVIISTPDKYKELCQNFICMFDTIVPFHYSDDDRKQGYINSKGRTNRMKKMPLMSVTIALVIKNNPAEFNSIIELNERVAEVKQYLKKIPASKYMADRRIIKNEDHLTLQLFNNDESLVENYRPIGQILVDKNKVTAEQLDRALKIHWKRGAYLGEVLRDLGYVTSDSVEEALMFQEEGLYSQRSFDPVDQENRD